MERTIRTVLGILAAAWLATVSHAAPASIIGNASWIWGPLSNDVVELRRVFTLDDSPTNATAFITADNGYELYVNGTLVGSDVGVESDVWQTVERYELKLARGKNVIGIRGTDLGGIRGLIAAFRVDCSNGKSVEIVTDSKWTATIEGDPRDYSHPEFIESAAWRSALIVGPNGMAPWGKMAWRPGAAPRKTRSGAQVATVKPGTNFAWPGPIAFLTDDRSVYVPLRADAWGVAFRVRDWSRAYTEFDLPCPSKIGRKLMTLRPGPNAAPKLLLDAGDGVIGSPAPTYDGTALLVSMARDGEKFFHIYRVPLDGAPPVRLTDGTFHDIDPAELPDGRIVFTSTRIGTFEEYHSPPSRALFVMNADGSNISSITHTLIFDNEPKVMADGRIAFIRTDNFFDRGKVETQLHVVRPDGTDGLTEAGADVGADYGVRLRILGYGSPAPLPDGRLAFISNRGNFICAPGSAERDFHRLPDPLADLAPLPDGRLLATVLRGVGPRTVSDVIAVIDPSDNQLVAIHEQRGVPLHSPVSLVPQKRPPVIPDYTGGYSETKSLKTGFLFCSDVRFTRKSKADWRAIKSVRVLGAIPLTVRSSHSHIVHVGHETVELGTVPLAPDGSFFVEVPADTPLALQAVDAEGRSELNQMSWMYVRPGERRSCIGCHQERKTTPHVAKTTSLALKAPALKTLGQGNPHKFRGNNPGVTGMMDLQFERFRECASINLVDAPAGEGAPAWKDEIKDLITTLRGTNTPLKISAAQRLGLMREHSAAPSLTQRLVDRDREVRVAAALALASCGTRDSVPALLEAILDPDHLVAQASIVALENLVGGTIAPFDPFAAVEVRRTQATAMRSWFDRHGWEAIEKALIPRISLAQPDPPRRAIVALGHVGSEPAAAALRDYVSAAAPRNPYPKFEHDNRTDTFTYPAASPLNPRTLQEAVRALGQIRDPKSVPLLAGILSTNLDPRTANLYLAEAAIEALGRIGSPDAESALLNTFAALKDYWDYVGWYSDHPALYACHSSPVHARLIEALDRVGSTRAGHLAPALIRSVPTDPDRALLPENDAYEILVGRVLRRTGRHADVIETCLALLGDPSAKISADIKAAILMTHPAWGGKPGPENRAAQMLSLACRETHYEPRIRAAFERFVAMPEEPIKRELGNPTWTPVRHWTLFYLARSLGNLGDRASSAALARVLDPKWNEARHGRPDPASPEIHFLHLDYTPCWRAAAAWAIGRIGDREALPTLLSVIRNFDNALDVRHAAAKAAVLLAKPADLAELKVLAATYPEVSTKRVLLAAAESLAAATTQTTPDNL